MLRSFFLLVVVLFMAGVGCGESDSKDAVSVVPTYEIGADGVECGERARITSSTGDSCSIYQCDWLCASYKEKEPVHVHLSFRKCEGMDSEWVLQSEIVQNADRATCDILQRQ